jgi:hypothetical protein
MISLASPQLQAFNVGLPVLAQFSAGQIFYRYVTLKIRTAFKPFRAEWRARFLLYGRGSNFYLRG